MQRCESRQEIYLNTDFWMHEWNEHNGGKDQVEYFKTGLSAFAEIHELVAEFDHFLPFFCFFDKTLLSLKNFTVTDSSLLKELEENWPCLNPCQLEMERTMGILFWLGEWQEHNGKVDQQEYFTAGLSGFGGIRNLVIQFDQLRRTYYSRDTLKMSLANGNEGPFLVTWRCKELDSKVHLKRTWVGTAI
uniref:FBA_2 domain-containing protein n=1 Tax=Steinernema glaseri TaxID=37863 RepID=A0A1I7Y4N7_9BILA